MKILESYSLSSGQKIGKIHINEQFYPLDIDNYLVIQPYTKQAKTYSFWGEVLQSLLPILEQKNIKVVQVGGPNEKPLPGCICTAGTTTIGQVAYIIKNSTLVFGVDSFSLHLAGHYNKPLVGLYSSNYKECCAPYFGDKTKQILIEPDRTKRKPSFAYEENPKEIDQIKPEIIVKSVLELLGCKNVKTAFNSLYFGPLYTRYLIETVPNQVVTLEGLNIDSIIYRMDYVFNENNLHQQLLRSKVSIITNKPINLELLKTFKDKIVEFIYVLDEGDSPKFAAEVQKVGLNFHLMSFLPPEEIQKKKIDYMDIGVINCKNQKKPDEVKDKTGLFFKTNKFLLSEGKIYTSKPHWQQNRPIENFAKNLCEVVDHPDFWNESEYFYLVERVNS